MSEMIERVARAISAAESAILLGADRNNVGADPRALARAAIEAMRDPTEAMVKTAYDFADEATGIDGAIGTDGAREMWVAMIDAVLEEDEGPTSPTTAPPTPAAAED